MLDALLGLGSAMNYDLWRSFSNNDPTIMGQNGLWSDAGLSKYMTQYFKDYDKDINDYFMNKEMAYNRDMAQLAQSYNVYNMKLQQDFERTMSSTAYQRAMSDMKKAGLNPASMVGNSAIGASTPSTGLAKNSAASVRAPYSSSSPISYHNSGRGFSSSGLDSLFTSVLSSSNDARKGALKELEDNAKHLHKLEEKQEYLAQKRLDARIAQWEKYKNG